MDIEDTGEDIDIEDLIGEGDDTLAGPGLIGIDEGREYGRA